MNTDNIQIIWSADGISKGDLFQILANDNFPRDRVAVKLDRLFLTQYGLQTISDVQNICQVPVFADAKIIEVPSKVLEITKLHLEHQPWMLNVMAGACNTYITPHTPIRKRSDSEYDLLYHFAVLCREADTLSCAVSVLTSKTTSAVKHEYRTDPNAATVNYAHLMQDCALTDIVCSPQEVEALLNNDIRLDINTPGIRLPGSNLDDQSRVNTPSGAFAAGVKRIVVGRDIYRVGENYETIFTNIEKIFTNIKRGE